MSDLPLIPDYLARAKVITDALDRLYIPLRASEEALTMLRESVYMSSPGQSQWNMCLTGPSGAGKTYMLDRFQLEMKQRLCPDDPNAIPVLIVKTPEDPTLDRMVDQVLIACQDEFAGMGRYRDKMARLPLALELRRVIIILFDEFHHLFDGKTPRQHRLAAQWLKALHNLLRWPIGLVGLESILEYVESSTELKRRFKRKKSLPFYSLADDFDLSELNAMLSQIAKLVPQAPTATIDTRHMMQRIWLGSLGSPDTIFWLAKNAVIVAFRQGSDRVSLDHWSGAFKELQSDASRLTPVINPFELSASEVSKQVARVLDSLPPRR